MMEIPSAQRIRHILTSSPVTIYTCNVDDGYGLTFVSDNVLCSFGYTADECIHNNNFWDEVVHPDDHDHVFDGRGDLISTGHEFREYRFLKKDGSYLWVHDEMCLISDDKGAPVEIVGSWLDITDRKETEDALRNSEKRFREFFQSNPVATIITTPEGLVHAVNPAFIESSGYSEEEIVGHSVQELGFWADPSDRDRMLSAIAEHGGINRLECRLYRKDNKEMIALVSSRAIKYEGELKILNIVTDVTEQRTAEEAMRKLDKAKSDFISTAAHELRTPLIAIVGYCELLEKAESIGFSVEQRESYLSIIQSNADILNRLIDDLLDIGRIQVGRSLGVSPKENDLREIVDKVVASSGVKTGRHEIVVERSSDFPQSVWLDAGRITQVLHNLLNNAIKYSAEGGVIKVLLSGDTDKISVSIADRGIGMTAEQMEHIFERFYRVDPDSLETIGLGLGMSIVKQIIDDHGGRINVSSQLGEGTTVTFELPVKS